MPTVPKVSVVITCYNYGRYLKEAIESVLDQTWQDYEIIVIDDGSTDDTPLIMEVYQSNEKIRYLPQANQGQPKAKNRGIAESTGEYVAFLDADDIWLPDKLELQLEMFSDPAVGVVYARRYWMGPAGNSIGGNERTLRRGNILNHIFVDNFICFSSAMVRRVLLNNINGFDDNLPMGIDYDLWIRLAVFCRFDFVDRPLVKYRTGHANLSKNTERRYECAQKIMNKHLSDPGIRSKLSLWVPPFAWSDTWMNMGYAARKREEFRKAILYYIKAIIACPILLGPWRGLLCSLIHLK